MSVLFVTFLDIIIGVESSLIHLSRKLGTIRQFVSDYLLSVHYLCPHCCSYYSMKRKSEKYGVNIRTEQINQRYFLEKKPCLNLFIGL